MTGGARVLATGLAHRFPGTPWLYSGLDLDLRPGEVTGLCGPSGCGKSTLMSVLAGWTPPVEGTVRFEGVERTGWIFQNPHGVPGRTALDHVVLPLLARGYDREGAQERALATMTDFHLGGLASRPYRELSGGEAQRLMLARALCSDPDLILVDEPTAQLDLRTARSVNTTLGRVAAQGAIVVVATHDPGTRRACTRIVDLGDYG
ncbi:ATP-binding cassette domain-containing protein [Nocardiopsis metallicus]|uniref:ABC-type lipoprotein export system ATPase subunit n=1 Tax=Nocardiopsis metallicus TaxID=179819 RepID=A0A840WCW2_9ACTN|nr:ATP-binding cassette domain-containing protein [Nocardiopsis metallicus]MBB5489587.1 ABC-type lipoprotein export system ATPase subunit [Nocardiopsis metallicus]